MNEVITEKAYPISTIWLFKQIMPFVILFPILFLYLFTPAAPYILIFILALSGFVIIRAVQRANFHYSLEEKFIILNQGVVSKQNRNIPYGRIQGVFIHQGIFERMFNLASLTLEDYSQGGHSSMSIEGYVGTGKSRHETLGFIGNRIHIPGLKKNNAETLKAIILQRVKENPIEDSQSGL